MLTVVSAGALWIERKVSHVTQAAQASQVFS